MSEGYTIDADDETAGIVVRYEGERGFRFHSASRAFDALDGHVFVTPAAAERAAREFAQVRAARASFVRLEDGDERARGTCWRGCSTGPSARWATFARRARPAAYGAPHPGIGEQAPNDRRTARPSRLRAGD